MSAKANWRLLMGNIITNANCGLAAFHFYPQSLSSTCSQCKQKLLFGFFSQAYC